MIYKLTFSDGRIDWCTARDPLHLLKSYDDECGLTLQEVESLEEISEEEARQTMVTNTDYDGDDPEDRETISIYDLAVGEDFTLIASTEFE